MYAIIVVALFLGCAPTDDKVFGPPSAKRISSDLVAVAGDSLYCRDAEFWQAYCDRWNDGLALGGCEAIATCGPQDTHGVAAIVSDTAWVDVNPSDNGWLRMPQEFTSSRFQRWIHPAYSYWVDLDGYEQPTPPSSIGLVAYPFRTQSGKRILYGFPSESGFGISRGSEAVDLVVRLDPSEIPEIDSDEINPGAPISPPPAIPIVVRDAYVGELWIQQIDRGHVVESLPAWLSFSEDGSQIGGVPLQVGMFEFSITTPDGYVFLYQITVHEQESESGMTPIEGDRTFIYIILDQIHGLEIPAHEDAVSFSTVGDLPFGLSISLPEQGLVRIEGAPWETGEYAFDLVAMNAAGDEIDRLLFYYVVIQEI